MHYGNINPKPNELIFDEFFKFIVEDIDGKLPFIKDLGLPFFLFKNICASSYKEVLILYFAASFKAISIIG